MPYGAFYSVLPRIGACYTVRDYSTAKPSCLIDLHYRVVTLSTQGTLKVIYGYVIVQGFQF